MILTCPECGTQYVVKDGAIPPGGRQVRCAACKHSWHQNPEGETQDKAPGEDVPQEPPALDEIADSEPATDETAAADWEPEAESDPDADAYHPFDPIAVGAGATAAVPVGAEAGVRGGEAEEADSEPPPAAEPQDDFSPFADRSVTIEPRRNRILPILLVVALIAALAAAFWFLAPQEWRARLGLADAGRTPLQLMLTHSDRQPLESGNELLAVSGRVINPTDESQSVPPIRAQLRSRTGELVYSWTIAPPARTLPPGASATFNSAEVNVPAGGDDLTLSLGEPAA